MTLVSIEDIASSLILLYGYILRRENSGRLRVSVAQI